MALKEGRCINCGSFLFLDPKMPEGHCFFCDCVFKNEEAFRALTNPEEFEFPNEPQPKYEGPSLTPAQVQRGPVVPVVSRSAKKTTPADDYVLPEKKVPKLKIPVKSILIMLAVAIVIVGIFAAIAVPTIVKRDARRLHIGKIFASSIPMEIDVDKDLLIQNLGCTSAVVVLKEDVTLDEGIELFHKYCDARAEILEIEDGSFAKTRKPVTLRVATPSGGYLIDKPSDEAALKTTAVTILK
ncbi:MAG TPA: hypothetical protein PL100_00940 [Bacillota bacterium]|mgnify:FL=1|jgi:hypothetical protein|nr:hypothetical protein [Bacillota bacterium]HQC48081.1 hypothetical protein [Bacillota bacterium]